MRFVAFFLAGTATFAAAAAQEGSAYFLPVQDRLPAMLFAPDPLAGTLMQRFVSQSAVAAAPDAAVVPVAVEQPVPAVAVAEQELQTMAVAMPGADPENTAEPEANLPPSSLAADMAAADLPQQAAALDPALPVESEASVETLPEPEVAPDAAAAPAAEGSAPATEEPPPAEAAAPSSGKITVIVENVEEATGSINVAICDKSLSREGCPYVREVPASLGFVETEFDDIPPGTYAVVGYHDVNGNNSFDKLLGMPREPYALSNNAGEKLIPTFNDASLKITPGDNAIIIRLQRLGG